VPQPSVAVALPSAAEIAADAGLHPTANALPEGVIVGAALSLDHTTVREVVAVLPQPSIAVNVLVCDVRHPLPV